MTTTTNTTKTTTTQVQALAWLIDHAPADTPADVLESARRLLATKSKKYERKSSTPTKASRENAILAHDLVDVLTRISCEPTAKNILNAWNDPNVRSVQKVVAVAKVAEANGLIRKYVNDKKQTCYATR